MVSRRKLFISSSVVIKHENPSNSCCGGDVACSMPEQHRAQTWRDDEELV